MPRQVRIYNLRCPFTDKIFYVGATAVPLSVRLRQHYSQPTTKRLQKRGISPIIETIETVSLRDAASRERYWIREYKSLGHPLENQPNDPIYQRKTVDGRRKNLYKNGMDAETAGPFLRNGRKFIKPIVPVTVKKKAA